MLKNKYNTKHPSPKAFSKLIIAGGVLLLVLIPIALVIQHQSNSVYEIKKPPARDQNLDKNIPASTSKSTQEAPSTKKPLEIKPPTQAADGETYQGPNSAQPPIPEETKK